MMHKPKALLILSFAALTGLAAAQTQGTGSSSSAGYPSSQSSSASSSSKTNASTNTGLSASDKKFVKEAAQGNLAEVELGQLATQKASADDVKKFGQRMADDHGKANEYIKDAFAIRTFSHVSVEQTSPEEQRSSKEAGVL